MKRAFLINLSEHSLSNLPDYADEIIPITSGQVEGIFSVEPLQQKIIDVLEEKNFDKKKDYLVLNGHIILVFITAKVVYEHFQGALSDTNLLLWDAKKRKYIERNLG